MKIKALVIDDEPLARNVIKSYLEDLPEIDVEKYCSDGLEAIRIMQEKEIDLVFLDINMPKISGIELLKTIKNPPLVIMTTAYPEYALEGYELDVVDYLMKPFSLQRFLKAIRKAQDQLKLREKQTVSDRDSFFFRSNKKTMQLKYKDILFIEGLGDYLKIFAENEYHITNLTMKKIESELPEQTFFRIHKSFIINSARISSIEGNLVEIGKHRLVIGAAYRQAFFEKIAARSV